MTTGVLHSDPLSMGGVKRFPNTRAPVSYFSQNLAAGVGIDEFCRNLSVVDPDDCRAVLQDAEQFIEQRQEHAIEIDRVPPNADQSRTL